jgi:hypothetical protein
MAPHVAVPCGGARIGRWRRRSQHAARLAERVVHARQARAMAVVGSISAPARPSRSSSRRAAQQLRYRHDLPGDARDLNGLRCVQLVGRGHELRGLRDPAPVVVVDLAALTEHESAWEPFAVHGGVPGPALDAFAVAHETHDATTILRLALSPTAQVPARRAATAGRCPAPARAAAPSKASVRANPFRTASRRS